MPKFIYVAANNQNQPSKGTLEAASRSAVIAALRERDLRPISIKEQGKGGSLSSFSFGGGKAGKVKSDTLVIFTRELSAMIGAGVPLLRSISALGEHSDSPALKKTLIDIAHSIEGGSTFGDALAKYPATFSDVYVNMVRAGEAAGILDEILKRLAVQQEKNATIKKKVKSAMTYPSVLVFITVVAFFGLMIFVIPKIGGILTSLAGDNAKLPALTLAMLGISHFLTTYWYIIVPIAVGGAFGFIRYIRTPGGKHLLHVVILKTPAVKTIVMKVAIARFARTFSALMGAGVPILESLSVTAHAVGNTVYEKAILDAAEEVKNGATLSSIVEQNPLFPAIVSQMLAVGEETGQTDKVLVKVADFYEEEVDVAIEGLSSIIEPVMIVFMGAMVGLIAASVMLPIANLSQSIKS